MGFISPKVRVAKVGQTDSSLSAQIYHLAHWHLGRPRPVCVVRSITAQARVTLSKRAAPTASASARHHCLLILSPCRERPGPLQLQRLHPPRPPRTACGGLSDLQLRLAPRPSPNRPAKRAASPFAPPAAPPRPASPALPPAPRTSHRPALPCPTKPRPPVGED